MLIAASKNKMASSKGGSSSYASLLNLEEQFTFYSSCKRLREGSTALSLILSASAMISQKSVLYHNRNRVCCTLMLLWHICCKADRDILSPTYACDVAWSASCSGSGLLPSPFRLHSSTADLCSVRHLNFIAQHESYFWPCGLRCRGTGSLRIGIDGVLLAEFVLYYSINSESMGTGICVR